MSKFKKMTRKQKVEHIWEYYRFYIFGGIFVLIFISSLLFSILGPKSPKSAVDVVIMGKYHHDEEKIDKFRQEIEDIINDGKNGKVELTMHNVDWETPSTMEVALNQKLMLMFRTQEIDVMIVEESKFDSYIEMVQECIYQPLEDIPQLSDLLAEKEDKLVRRRIEDDKERVYGLYSKDNKILEQIGLGEDYVISVPISSSKKDNAFEVIKWLYK